MIVSILTKQRRKRIVPFLPAPLAARLRISLLLLSCIVFGRLTVRAQSLGDLVKKAKAAAREQAGKAAGQTPGKSAPASQPAPAAAPAGTRSGPGQPARLPGASIGTPDPDEALTRALNDSSATECAAAFAAGAHAQNYSLTQVVRSKDTTLPLVRCFVEHGSAVDEPESISQQNSGWTTLLAAFEAGHPDFIPYLVERGANVNAVTPTNQAKPRIPLVKAIEVSHLDLVELLIGHGADVTVLWPSGHAGTTLLDEAIFYRGDRSNAFQNRHDPESLARLTDACSIESLLQSKGAHSTVWSAHFGSIQADCAASHGDQIKRMQALDAEAQQKDQQQLSLETDNAANLCSSGFLKSFYDCSCFVKEFTAYRSANGVREPMNNVLRRIDFNACYGPKSPMKEFGFHRALEILQGDQRSAAVKDQIAHCTGEGVAAAFPPQPTLGPLTIILVNGQILNALTRCNQTAGR